MAPEQNEGEMLFQTDVYSFGVIMFELLAGIVPFPLSEKGVTARNNIRLSHLETLPPDVVLLRKERIPSNWPSEKAEKESYVPGWIVKMIYKCLEKKPENRFANGVELYDFVQLNRTQSKVSDGKGITRSVKGDEKSFETEREKLQEQVVRYQQELESTEREIAQLRGQVRNIEDKAALKEQIPHQLPSASKKVVSYSSFLVLSLFAVALAVFSGFSLFRNNKQETTESSTSTTAKDTSVKNVARQRPVQQKQVKAKTETDAKPVAKKPLIKAPDQTDEQQDVSRENTKSSAENRDGKYVVKSIAYFYDQPAEGTQRKAFINHWNNALLNPIDEKDGFIYIIFRNQRGQVSKGWLRKKDLSPAGG
jgi:serine/threonine-protein kinase